MAKLKKDYPRPNHKIHTDSWVTDAWVMKMFEDFFDPCPLNPNWNPYDFQDGLMLDWKDKTFVNPPYSNPLPWVEKAIRENHQGKYIALLLKHDTSTRWYSLLHGAGAKFLLVSGRLKFGKGSSCAFPCFIAILN